MNSIRYVSVLALLAVSVMTKAAATADTITRFKGTYEAEAFATASMSGDHTPFWLISNRAGLGSPKTNTGYIRSAYHAAGQIDKAWSWSAGVDLVGSWRSESPFIIREFFGEIRFRAFMLTLGSKLLDDRIVDTNLSSGDLLFSGNALPIPQVRLSMPDFMYVPGTKGWLGFKIYGSFGLFTDGNWLKSNTDPDRVYTKNVLFHSKGLRVRIGNTDKFPVTFEGGLEMAAQFGGDRMKGNTVVQHLPHGFKDIFKIIIPQGGGGSDLPGEQSNVLGNHVGEWSARLSWAAPHDMDISVYYLHYFEDHSMMFMDYVWHDGLWGFEFKLPENPVLGKVVYEYLYMKDQAGPVYWDHTPEIPEQVSGRDNYYNHYLYNAWQHWGMGIGNPLIISPIWNGDGSNLFKCNRIISHHIGLSGQPTTELGWRILASHTRGWGTYGIPYPEVKRNINFLGEVTWAPERLKGWSGTLGIAVDRGNMLGRSCGAMFSIKKTGIL